MKLIMAALDDLIQQIKAAINTDEIDHIFDEFGFFEKE